MIKVISSKKDKKEINSIRYKLRKSNIIANKRIAHFIELLGYDYTLFNHLYNIDIRVNYDTCECKKDEEAHYEATCEYNPNRNGISLNTEFIDDFESYDDIAYTIIHEKLHANRDVLLKNEINYLNILDYLDYCDFSLEDKKIYNECLIALNNTISNKKIQVLKIVNYKEYSLVYIYDKEENYFSIYKLNNISNLINYNNMNNSYNNIINYIKANNIIPIKEFINHNNNQDYVYEITGIYAPHGRFNKTNEIKKANMLINYQTELEEILIEIMTSIIDYHKDKDFLDIDGFCNQIISKSNNVLLLNCIKIFYKYKEEFINKFLLSSYQDERVNELENIFLNDYAKFIKLVSKIYSNNFEISLNDEIIIDEIAKRRLK